MPKHDLDVAYAGYMQNPTVETYEFLGKELLAYLNKTIKTGAAFRSRDLAEEALGATCVSVFNGLRDFKGEAAFTTWVRTLLDNEYGMMLRKQVTHAEVPLKVASKERDETFEDRMQQRIILRELIAQCAPEDQKLIQLKKDGFTDVEVAEKLGVSFDTATQRWKRLKVELASKVK